MSLSQNWEKLGAKLGAKIKAPNKVRKPKRERKRHDVTQVAVLCTQRLGPLAYALWNTPPGSKLEVVSRTALHSVKLADPRKLAAGKYVAIDCEFVGVGNKERSAVARVSLVNLYGIVLLDAYVQPRERVTDWRTWVSGVGPRNMDGALSFEEAQEKVRGIVENRILVGHAVENDLKALQLTRPRNSVVDTALFNEYREMANGKAPSLRRLCSALFQVNIQRGAHSSVEDALATMALFRLHQFRSSL